MLGNYLRVATRNILKRKLYSFINAFGLSIGIAYCLLIYLFIRDEQGFDQFHVNKNEIYRIHNRGFDYMDFKKGVKEPYSVSTQLEARLAGAMAEELPEVQTAGRYFRGFNGLLAYRDKVFRERLTFVDPAFFKMFSFKLIVGNPDKLFKNKSEVVLTSALAEKYFGTENPIGKLMVLDMNRESTVTVAGIIENPPANSSLLYEILLPLEALPWYEDTWNNGFYLTFAQLRPSTNVASFEKNLNALYNRYKGDQREFREREKIPDELKMNELHVTNLNDIHLDTKVVSDRSSDPKYAFILSGIGILILVIACINYISLALTGSSNRKTEVGIRKVSGAAKKQLVFQFTMESVVLAFVSMILGVVMVTIFLPAFNSFTGKDIVLSPSNALPFVAITFLMTGLIGMIAGSYPAFYLSGLNPVQILKGFTSKANTWFTKPLLVTQFAFSAFLIMSSVAMHQQMKFVTTKDLGYDQRQVLFIPANQGWGERSDRFIENFRTAVAGNPSVVSVSGTSLVFTHGTMTLGFQHQGEAKTASGYIVDPQYTSTLGIPFVQGRNFDLNNPADLKDAVIVNESLVKALKWTDPLGERLKWRLGTEGAGSPVIGVIKDHHYLSLERTIEPMFLTMDKSFGHYQYILVKIAPQDISGSIKKLEKVYKTLAPDKPFEYTFLDENVARQYESYARWMNIMSLTAGFAILISCLGLFGLAGMNTVNRTKEIGIRKVLGAGITSLFVLLNKQFVWLSLIAFALAGFPAWLTMKKWLDSFQFKIQLSWVWFAMSMTIGLLVAMITVSYHTLKATRVNPADTLKYE